MWIAFSRLRKDRELACDAATLACLGKADHAAYAHTLLRVGACLPATPRVLPGLALLALGQPVQYRCPVSRREMNELLSRERFMNNRQAGFQNFTVEAMQRTNDIAAGVW